MFKNKDDINFQLLAEVASCGLMLVNNLGQIVYLNKYAENLFLYPRDELLGQELQILMPERYRKNHHHLVSKYFMSPEVRPTSKVSDLFALRKDGAEVPIEIGLQPYSSNGEMFVLATIIDISDTIKTNKQFKLIVNSAPYAMLLVTSKGEIVMMNKQTELLFGYSHNELVHQQVEILVPQTMRNQHPQMRDSFNRNPQARPMGAGRDLYAITKSGDEIPIEIGLTPIETNEGRFILTSIIDITERKKNEEAFKNYTKTIEEKNEELKQFNYLASHDLKEPLNSISSLIDLILNDNDYGVDEDLHELLVHIGKSSDRMKQLVSGLLDFTRIGRNAELVMVNLNTLIEDVIEDLSAIIKASSATITFDQMPSMKVFEVELRLLFQNLVGNAIKYQKPGNHPVIHIALEKQKDQWLVSVTDNGIGIQKEQLGKVFLLFQRLHAADEYGGIGIGLAHCKKIVELHNGEIWVESEAGVGSTFNFTIPFKIDQ